MNKQQHYKHTQEARLKISLSKRGSGNWSYGLYGKDNPLYGENSVSWKGDNITYKSLHRWVRKYKPQFGSCEDCGTTEKKLEVANISKEYKRDINDFKWLCRKCHRKFDGTSEQKRLKCKVIADNKIRNDLGRFIN